MIFGPKKDVMTGEQIELHHEDLQNCYILLILIIFLILSVALRPFVSQDSWLSGDCGLLDISQTYGPSQPVRGIALLYFHFPHFENIKLGS
jgi:hypothetical protein